MRAQVVYDEADEDVAVEDPFAGGAASDKDAEGSEGWHTDDEGQDDEKEDDDDEELSND